MRTSLDEALAIEQHLFRLSAADDRLLFTAKLIIDPILENKVKDQQQVYTLVQHYGRKQLKAELESAFRKVMTEPKHRSFARCIRKLFKLNS